MDHSQEEGDEVAHDTHHVALVPAGREVSTTVKMDLRKLQIITTCILNLDIKI